MINLLIRLFVKDYKNSSSGEVRERYGLFSGLVGLFANLLLFVCKIVIGFLSGSISVIADGINNLSDASSAVITFIGFKLSSQPEDEEHPYGHARIEYLTGLFVSIFIILVGLLLFKSSVEKVINPVEIHVSLVAIIILALSILVKLWLTFFYITVSKAINSIALKATAIDARNDVITTSVVLAGLFISKYTGLIIDGYLGCAVSLFIIWSGIQLTKEVSSPLLGEPPDESLVKDIISITQSYSGVLGMHDLIVHNYGPRKHFASMHVEVSAYKDVLESHDMIDNIEREVSEKLGIHFVLHMDPIITSDPLLEKVREIIRESISSMDGISDIHDLREVKGETHTNIIFDLVISSECKIKEETVQKTIEENIQKSYPDYFVVINFDRGYTYL